MHRDAIMHYFRSKGVLKQSDVFDVRKRKFIWKKQIYFISKSRCWSMFPMNPWQKISRRSRIPVNLSSKWHMLSDDLTGCQCQIRWIGSRDPFWGFTSVSPWNTWTFFSLDPVSVQLMVKYTDIFTVLHIFTFMVPMNVCFIDCFWYRYPWR